MSLIQCLSASRYFYPTDWLLFALYGLRLSAVGDGEAKGLWGGVGVGVGVDVAVYVAVGVGVLVGVGVKVGVGVGRFNCRITGR